MYYTNPGNKTFLWQSKRKWVFSPKWVGSYSISTVKFNGDCLKQRSVSFIHESVVNLYICYKLDT